MKKLFLSLLAASCLPVSAFAYIGDINNFSNPITISEGIRYGSIKLNQARYYDSYLSAGYTGAEQEFILPKYTKSITFSPALNQIQFTMQSCYMHNGSEACSSAIRTCTIGNVTIGSDSYGNITIDAGSRGSFITLSEQSNWSNDDSRQWYNLISECTK